MKAVMKCVFLSYALLILFGSCDTTEPPPPPAVAPTITLQVQNVGVTEAWLRVGLTDSNDPRYLGLQRDGKIVMNVTLLGTDSVLIDEALLPNHTYSYEAIRLKDSLPVDMSGKIEATTLDTTSHEWVFDSITILGDGNASTLYGVSIVSMSPPLVYAVGELYEEDSTGQIDPTPYNLATWDGISWTLHRVPYNFQGQLLYNPIQSVIAFNLSDIWFCGNGIVRWDGAVYTPIPIPSSVWGPYRMNKLAGFSGTDLYVGGDGGSIAHRFGSNWSRVASETTLDVYDIFGAQDTSGGSREVVAVAAMQFVTFDKRILRITSSGVIAESDSGIPYSIHGVWFQNGGPYYVVGSGMYRKSVITGPGSWQAIQDVTPYYIYAVRGSGLNNLFAAGCCGELLHFNGIGWRSYRDTPGFSGVEFLDVSCNEDLMVAVGYIQQTAVAVIGTRSQ